MGRIASLIALSLALATPSFLSLAAPAGPPAGKWQCCDMHGVKVFLPLGDASFADQVIGYSGGAPGPIKIYAEPKRALGPPDYESHGLDDNKYPASVSLGCHGQLTLKFTRNAIADVPGDDIWVFQRGAGGRGLVEISTDGRQWIHAGDLGRNVWTVDIAKAARPGLHYPFVRLTDAQDTCGAGDRPGLEVDAVAAMGVAVTIMLNAGLLFDSGKAELKPAASADLDGALRQIRQYADAEVTIEGHTDNVGTAQSNQALSLARAQAVKSYLTGRLKGRILKTAGYGASRPVAGNDSDTGRAANRRVDVVLTGKGAAP